MYNYHRETTPVHDATKIPVGSYLNEEIASFHLLGSANNVLKTFTKFRSNSNIFEFSHHLLCSGHIYSLLFYVGSQAHLKRVQETSYFYFDYWCHRVRLTERVPCHRVRFRGEHAGSIIGHFFQKRINLLALSGNLWSTGKSSYYFKWPIKGEKQWFS